MDEDKFSGYTVTYARGETQFPVYLIGFISTLLLAGGFVSGNLIVLGLGGIGASITYYQFPLLDTRRPRLGANQYGIFIEGFGLLRWRSVKSIELVPIAVRAMTIHELQIALNQPLGSALVADWRNLPFWRWGMRLPWSMTRDNVVHIKVDPFDHEPDEIHRTMLRMWRYYRS